MNVSLELDQPPVVERDFLADSNLWELVHGEAVEKRMGAKSDEIAGLLLTALNQYIRPRSLGRVYGAQTGYRCFPHDKNMVRKPDTSFVEKSRLTDNVSPDGYFTIAPDLAVEVISPNDLYEEMEVKLTDYKQAGIRLVWIVSPTCKTVQVRRLDGSLALLAETESLTGEDVIPGFTCPIAELFI